MTKSLNFSITGLFTAKETTLLKNRKPMLSGIKKTKQEKLIIKREEIEGDAVMNRKYHGGALRVIHHFPEEHYQVLKEAFKDVLNERELANKFILGSMGENISSRGVSEKDLCVGDIFQLGSAIIQLTVPRIPCNTTDINYQIKGIMKAIYSSGAWGWFYRVITPGEFSLSGFAKKSYSASVELVERPNPDLNLKDLIQICFYNKSLEKSDINFLKKALSTKLLDPLGFQERIEILLSKNV